jgi:AcrR family transcriptional regulator
VFNHRYSVAESGAIPDASATAEIAVMARSDPDPRERLLAAMIETVGLYGYERTTVRRVVYSAGLQEATFGEHFSDEHDCFMQATDDLLGRVEGAALAQFQRSAPWSERVRMGLHSLLHALVDDPAAARVALVEMLSAGPEVCERQRAVLGLFASLIEEGRSLAEDSSALPPQTSEAIVGGIVSILQRRVLQGNIAELPELHADLTYFALLPYLNHELALSVARPRTS